jgi:hypothetical protein
MENTEFTPERHPALPQELDAEKLAYWITTEAAITHNDQVKKYYTADEIREFEHESVTYGREYNRLTGMLNIVRELITKGNPDKNPIVCMIPPTIGTKLLEQFRRQCDDMVERGYEIVEVPIYGIPYRPTMEMLFFDKEGALYPDRTRPLSHKEREKYFGKKPEFNMTLVKNEEGVYSQPDTAEGGF